MNILLDIGMRLVIIIAAVGIFGFFIIKSVGRDAKHFVKTAGEEEYILRQPRFVLWLGIFSVGLFFSCFVFAFVKEGTWVGSLFLIFVILGFFLILYSIRWKIIVVGTIVQIFSIFGAPKEIDLREIDRVEQQHNGIIAYIGAEKVFTLELHVFGYELLYDKLHELGKMDSTQMKNLFTVRYGKVNLVVGISCSIFFGGALFWVIFWPNDTVTTMVYVCFAAFFILGIYLIISAIRWKIQVSENELSYCKPLGRRKLIQIKQITRVNVLQNGIVIVADKPLIKVESICKGYETLIERFQTEGIPFYQKGKNLMVK